MTNRKKSVPRRTASMNDPLHSDGANESQIDDNFDPDKALLNTKSSHELYNELGITAENFKGQMEEFINKIKEGDLKVRRPSEFRLRRLTFSQQTVESVTTEQQVPVAPLSARTKRTTIFSSTELGVKQLKAAPFPDEIMGTFSCHGQLIRFVGLRVHVCALLRTSKVHRSRKTQVLVVFCQNLK